MLDSIWHIIGILGLPPLLVIGFIYAKGERLELCLYAAGVVAFAFMAFFVDGPWPARVAAYVLGALGVMAPVLMVQAQQLKAQIRRYEAQVTTLEKQTGSVA